VSDFDIGVSTFIPYKMCKLLLDKEMLALYIVHLLVSVTQKGVDDATKFSALHGQVQRL